MKQLLIGLIAGAMVSCGASGCARIIVKNGESKAQKETPSKQTASSIIFGVEPVTNPIVLGEACPNGWAEIISDAGALESTLRILTLNLYSPSRVTVTCWGPKPPPPEDD